MKSLGRKIADLRKDKGITQEELAQKLNVTAQAVSKWENDISYPDIMTLPQLAKILGITVDELFNDPPQQEVRLVEEKDRKNFDDLMFRIIVDSAEGDKVRVNLPMPLVKIGLDMGMDIPQINNQDALKGVDLKQILDLVEKGVLGKLIEVESADGDIVEILVE